MLKKIDSLLLLLLLVTGCASFPTEEGGHAPFSTVSNCEAISLWLEPARERYSNIKISGWNEIDYKNNMSFLFTDENFVPVFGTSFDKLSRPQASKIRKVLSNVSNDCPDNDFIKTVYPGSILSRPFNHRLFNRGFSREFLTERVILERANKNGVAIRKVQQQLSQLGYELGAIDGIYGGRTSEAISAYKKDKGITPANGELNNELLTALNVDSPANAVEVSPRSVSKNSQSDAPQQKTNPDSGKSLYSQYVQTSMDECDAGDAYACFSVSYQFKNKLDDSAMATEYDAKTCLAAKNGSYGEPLKSGYLSPELVEDACFNAKMAVGGIQLSSKELQVEKKRRDAVGNLIPDNDTPLKREMIQEALDINLLQSQGLQPSQAVLKDCVDNYGCAVLGGLVRARWGLEEVMGCELVQSGLALCQFSIKVIVESTINVPGGLRDNMLQGMLAPGRSDGEGLFKFTNGSWRLEGGFLPDESK